MGFSQSILLWIIKKIKLRTRLYSNGADRRSKLSLTDQRIQRYDFSRCFRPEITANDIVDAQAVKTASELPTVPGAIG